MFASGGSSPTAGNVSNVVDKITTLNSLWYRNGVNSNHTTRINPGVSLNVTGITNVAGGTGFNAGNFLLLVGTNGNTTPSLNVRITGAGGALNLSNSAAALVVAQFNTTNKHVGVNLRAILDLSGLDTFRADINRFLIGAMNNGSAGIVYLARTNFIRLSGSAPQLDLGENNSNQGDPSLLYLGVTNVFFTDSIATSRAKGTNGSIYFNPAFVAENPVAVFRAADGSSRVGSWTIADLLAANGTPDVTQPVSTNDFRGGTVDALVDALVLGKTTTTTPGTFATSNRVSLGVLNFDAGVFDVNTLTNGLQLGNANAGAASWDTGIGAINVNGGTLRVNDTLVLAQGVAALGPASVQGTITVNNGLLAVNRLMAGNGTSTIVISNSTFALSNAMTGSGLSRLSLTNAQLRLSINGSAAAANILVTNLVAASMNTIAIDSITNVSSDTTLPLISYGNMTGTVAANFGLAPPPGNYAMNLIDNPAQKRIDVRIRQGTNPVPEFTGLALTSSDLLINGSNGAPNWSFYLRATTNIELPMSNWLVLSTNAFDFNGSFFLTNPLDPGFPQRFFRLEMR
jgi:hypothetical protein